MIKNFKKKNAFTIVEFLTSLTIISIILAVFIFVVRPQDRLKEARDNQREVHLNSIWHAIETKMYQDRGWEWDEEEQDCPPPQELEGFYIIGSGEENYDLYSCIYSDFLSDAVIDPKEGNFESLDDYYTGYKIGRATTTEPIILEAPDGETREIEIKFRD